jgi:primase-polymerase (primpol)-like protein
MNTFTDCRAEPEIYTEMRFATCTGWHVPGTPDTIESCDLSSVYARMVAGEFTFPEPRESEAEMQQSGSTTITNNRVLLQNGRWSDCQSPRYPSQNEADLALCSHLAREGFGTAE